MATPTLDSIQASVSALQTKVAGLSSTAKNSTASDLVWPFNAPLKKHLMSILVSDDTPNSITYASTITPDATSGNFFSILLTGNLTLEAPINAADGQKIIFEFIQDGTGSRTLTLGSGFSLGTTISSITLTTSANKRDFMGVIYRTSTMLGYVVAFAAGY